MAGTTRSCRRRKRVAIGPEVSQPNGRRFRPGSGGTSRWCGWRHPGRARRCVRGRPGRGGERGRRRKCGGGRPPPPASARERARITARSSSSPRSPTGRQGSTRAAKQASLLKMLPMPATTVWSSRASPRPRPGSAQIPATIASRSSSGARMSGSEPGELRIAADAVGGDQPQRRPAELDRFLLLAGQNRPGRAAGLAPPAPARVDVPRAVHPHMAVQDEVAEAQQQVLAMGLDPSRRRPSRRSTRAARPRGFGAEAATVSPVRAASRRRAARRIVSPSAIPP